jgi:hypothetical protein
MSVTDALMTERPGLARQVAAAPLGEVGLVFGLRLALWIAIQLLVAGLIVVAGFAGASQPLNAAAGWWMTYAALVDLAVLAGLLWLLRRNGVAYRSLFRPHTAVWKIAIGAVGVLLASAPAIFFSAELNGAIYPDATLPMLGIVDVPLPIGVASALVAPLLAELVEPLLYLGLLLPALERRLARSWLAAGVVVMVWAIEHAFYPVLLSGNGLDLVFAGYRVASVLPFLAIWTAVYYVFDRRLLPIMAARWVFNGGTAFAVALDAV